MENRCTFITPLFIHCAQHGGEFLSGFFECASVSASGGHSPVEPAPAGSQGSGAGDGPVPAGHSADPTLHPAAERYTYVLIGMSTSLRPTLGNGYV